MLDEVLARRWCIAYSLLTIDIPQLICQFLLTLDVLFTEVPTRSLFTLL